MSLEAGDTEFDSSVSDAADALLDRWKDAEEPSKDDTGATADEEGDETTPDTSDVEESDAADEAEGADSDAENEAADEADDQDDAEAIVEIEVDGEKREFTIEKLKRLAGQEAALNRKSMEAAEMRKQADRDAELFGALIGQAEQFALDRLAVFEDIDWNTAPLEYGLETYNAWRGEFAAAQAEIEQLRQMKTQADDHLRAHRDAVARREWEEALPILERDIEGWNDQHLNDLAAYAREHAPNVPEWTNAELIKILDKAMRHDRQAAAKAKAKDVIVKKKATGPTRAVAKTDNSSPSRKGDEAMAKLRKTGSTEDAMAALLDRWKA